MSAWPSAPALALAPQGRGGRPASGGTASAKPLSRQFAQWVVGLRYEDLPAPVIDRAKGLTLQNLASALLPDSLSDLAANIQK